MSALLADLNTWALLLACGGLLLAVAVGEWQLRHLAERRRLSDRRWRLAVADMNRQAEDDCGTLRGRQ